MADADKIIGGTVGGGVAQVEDNCKTHPTDHINRRVAALEDNITNDNEKVRIKLFLST